MLCAEFIHIWCSLRLLICDSFCHA